jgi:hypothetical protein
VDDVAGEIVTQLETIDGLRCHKGPPDSITPPAGILVLPDSIDFDQTYGRGSDRITWPLLVVVGRVSDRTVMTRIGAYCDGSGARSVKAVVEAGTYTAFDSLRVTRVEFDVLNWQNTDYHAAIFELDIFGQGS